MTFLGRISRRVLRSVVRAIMSPAYLWISMSMSLLLVPVWVAFSLTANGWWAWIGPVLLVSSVRDARRTWGKIREDREARRDRIVREVMES